MYKSIISLKLMILSDCQNVYFGIGIIIKEYHKHDYDAKHVNNMDLK